MKKTILALSMLSLVFVSCKKDDKDEPVTPTKENLTGSYKMTAATMASGSSSIDVFNNDMFTEACERDDIYKLNADLTYNVQDAGTTCSPTTAWTGTWSLVSTTSIDIDGDVYTIKSWNGKTLVGEATDNSSGTTITYTVTYVKQ
jgi:hypothetical protein